MKIRNPKLESSIRLSHLVSIVVLIFTISIVGGMVIFAAGPTTPQQAVVTQGGVLTQDLNFGGHNVTSVGSLTTTNLYVQSVSDYTNSTGNTNQVLTALGNGKLAWENSTGGGGGLTNNAVIPSYLNTTNTASAGYIYSALSTTNGAWVAPTASVTGIRKSTGAGSTDTAAIPGTDYATPASLYGGYASASISSAGTTALTPSGPVNSENITIGAGSGTYTASITLSHTGAVSGALYDILVGIPASSNPTVNIYDSSTGGTLLSTVTSNGTAGNTTLSFFYTGSAWVKFPKGALLSYQNLADLLSASTARTNLGLGTAATISSTAGGDLSGTLPSPTVTGINGVALSSLATGLHWNTTSTGAPSIATANQVASVLTGTTGTLNLTSSTVTVATQTAGDSSNKPASTAFVATSFAPLASPTFTGAPSLPTGTTGVTQSAGNNSTKLATTAYTDAAVAAGGGAALNDYRNKIINGDMRINQRAGTSITSSTAYVAQDRWYESASGANVTIGNSTAGTNGFQTAMLITGASSNTGIVVGQRIEATSIYELAYNSGTVTVSVWANSSSITSLVFNAYVPGSSSDNWGSRSGSIATHTWTISSTQAEYTYSFPLTGNTNGLEIEFTTGALTATNTLTLTGVQLEGGSTATAFERLPIVQELQQCQRYFCTSYDPGTVPGTATYVGMVGGCGFGYQAGNYFCGIPITFPVPMRVAPSSISMWDGAGTASKTTAYQNGAYTNNYAGASVITTSTKNMTIYTTAGAFNVMVHYTASAEL